MDYVWFDLCTGYFVITNFKDLRIRQPEIEWLAPKNFDLPFAIHLRKEFIYIGKL